MIMNLFLICLVLLASNSILLYAYQQKCFLLNTYNNLMATFKIKDRGLKIFLDLNEAKKGVFSLKWNSIKPGGDSFEMNDFKPLEDLTSERIHLNSNLKMLEFITTFEMYLNENKVDRARFNQFNEFSELKLCTQISVLESTRKVSTLSLGK